MTTALIILATVISIATLTLFRSIRNESGALHYEKEFDNIDCRDVEKFYPLAVLIVNRYCAGRNDFEDAVQEVITKAWCQRDKYNPEVSCFSTYIRMVMKNACIDYVRSKNKFSQQPFNNLIEKEYMEAYPVRSDNFDAELSEEVEVWLESISDLKVRAKWRKIAEVFGLLESPDKEHIQGDVKKPGLLKGTKEAKQFKVFLRQKMNMNCEAFEMLKFRDSEMVKCLPVLV